MALFMVESRQNESSNLCVSVRFQSTFTTNVYVTTNAQLLK